MEGTRSIEQCVVEECLQAVTVADSGQVNGIFIFGPDFPAFEGHFPGRPAEPSPKTVNCLTAKVLRSQICGAAIPCFPLARLELFLRPAALAQVALLPLLSRILLAAAL